MPAPAELLATPFSAHYPAGIEEWIDVYGYAVPLTFGDPLAEYTAVRTAVGITEYSMLYKWHVTGPGAVPCVDAIFSRSVTSQPTGRISYGVIVTDHGCMVDDVTVAVHRPDLVVVTGGNPDTAHHLAAAAPEGTTVTERRSETAVLSLQGPRSREVLQTLTTTPVDNHALPYYQFRTDLDLAGIPAQVNRLGFTAELGYELQVPVERAGDLWHAVTDAGQPLGLRPFAAAALMMCRVEAGMIMGGLEYDERTSPYECRMGWAIDLDKGPFQGREALAAAKDTAPTRLVSINLGPGQSDADGVTLHHEGVPVGHITMAVPSPHLGGDLLALARITPTAAKVGTALTAALPDGTTRTGQVVATPVYDPQRSRVRA
ncbi:hypothetical protein GHK86_00435 [Acidimicrobiaceae bacterium USS-CC1]|uniref:Aminomethyl transferase family protein n=1 Tax=Acidiferrimicrobium australe TaxID=2664430 RepID=A0ABW9QNY0_9ACTN|nr:hypothetical protein [Acidiferrimicrobium australe]